VQAQDAQPKENNSKFALGILFGYNRGFGTQVNATVFNPIPSLPIHLRAGIGFTSLEPGNSADARRIFINNATNGVPEEKAKAFDYRLDVLIPITLLGNAETYISAGPRYSSFRANFKYVGGNEDFDVTTKQFGFGAGLEAHFRISPKLDAVILGGLDYYLDATLIGHDTQYSPDNDNVNARNDNENDNAIFTYGDADDAIKQPQLMPRLLVGIQYRL